MKAEWSTVYSDLSSHSTAPVLSSERSAAELMDAVMWNREPRLATILRAEGQNHLPLQFSRRPREIDHFVMAITAAGARVLHIASITRENPDAEDHPVCCCRRCDRDRFRSVGCRAHQCACPLALAGD